MLDRSEEIDQLATRVFLAEHFCTKDILQPPADEPAREALLWMELNDFDLAPLAGTNGALLIRREVLKGASLEQTVGSLATETPIEHWVESDVSLRQSLELLGKHEWLFVRDNQRLMGILTRSDLSSPVVSGYLLARLLGMERGLRRLYGTYAHEPVEDEPGETGTGDGWTLTKVLNRIASMKALRDDLGMSARAAFEKAANRLVRLRNRLAHGGSILSSFPNTADAIEQVTKVEAFVGSVQRLVANREAIWKAIAKTSIVDSANPSSVWAGTGAGDLVLAPPVHVLTGQNPHEKVLTVAENKRRHVLLGQYLRDHPRASQMVQHEVVGRSSEGPWAEDSWAVSGLGREDALRIGGYFQQRAIFELTATQVHVVAIDGRVVVSVSRCR